MTVAILPVAVSPVPIVVSKTSSPLRLAPIVPEWIVSGAPVARNAMLCNSEDWAGFTVEWDCTAGQFDWFYDIDETIHILEGSVILDDGHGPARTFGPGDVVFFPAGSRVRWNVEKYVHKLAYFRKPYPRSMSLAIKAARRVVRIARSAMGRAQTPVPVSKAMHID